MNVNLLFIFILYIYALHVFSLHDSLQKTENEKGRLLLFTVKTVLIGVRFSLIQVFFILAFTGISSVCVRVFMCVYLCVCVSMCVCICMCGHSHTCIYIRFFLFLLFVLELNVFENILIRI